MEGNSIPRFWNRFALKAKGGEHIRTFFGWSFPRGDAQIGALDYGNRDRASIIPSYVLQ